jgi:hypothetical protein
LARTGFCRVERCAADVSRIPGFTADGLDMAQGKVRKPDSLFMEASKAPAP